MDLVYGKVKTFVLKNDKARRLMPGFLYDFLWKLAKIKLIIRVR
jgi:hypothetical protein